MVTPIDDQHDRNLCVTCILREGSDARGCLVSLQLHQENETEPSNFIVRGDEHCLVQEQGLYTVEVFDVQADGNLSKLPAYSQENLRIPRPPRPPCTYTTLHMLMHIYISSVVIESSSINKHVHFTEANQFFISFCFLWQLLLSQQPLLQWSQPQYQVSCCY